jgi:hypothetical protein
MSEKVDDGRIHVCAEVAEKVRWRSIGKLENEQNLLF